MTTAPKTTITQEHAEYDSPEHAEYDSQMRTTLNGSQAHHVERKLIPQKRTFYEN